MSERERGRDRAGDLSSDEVRLIKRSKLWASAINLLSSDTGHESSRSPRL